MSSSLRVRAVGISIAAVFLVLALRVAHLSVLRGDEFRRRAAERLMTTEVLLAKRGEIQDRHGRPLVRDEVSYDLHVRVAELEGVSSVRRMARLLGVPRARLIQAVDALAARLDDLAAGDPAQRADLRRRAYALDGLEVALAERHQIELTLAAHEYHGFSVARADDGTPQLAVCLAELRGEAVLDRLAGILGGTVTVDRIRAELAGKEAWFIKELARRTANIPTSKRRQDEMLASLRTQALPMTSLADVPEDLAFDLTLHPERYVGFELEATPRRRHLHDDLADNFLGEVASFEVLDRNTRDRLRERAPYRDEDFVGTRGLERWLEARLHGIDGYRLVERRAHGGRTRNILEVVPARDGQSVRLTIDLELQAACETILDSQPQPGAIVMLAPATGEILAMASTPRYTREEYEQGYAELLQRRPSPLVDRAVAGSTYQPPGSIFKLITAVAALESGTIDETTTFECTARARPYCGNHTGSRGPISLVPALALSCNVFFADTAVQCGSAFDHWVWRAGFGQKTGIEVGETAFTASIEKVREGGFARRQAGIGQIVEASPLQMARFTAALANGGILTTPHLVADRRDLSRRDLDLSPRTLALVDEGMRAVVAHGTARHLPLLTELRVAGKTGSAEIGGEPVEEGLEPPTHAWFTGYAPAEAPRVVVTVFLSAAGHGGDVAAPLAAEALAAWHRIVGGW